MFIMITEKLLWWRCVCSVEFVAQYLIVPLSNLQLMMMMINDNYECDEWNGINDVSLMMKINLMINQFMKMLIDVHDESHD